MRRIPVLLLVLVGGLSACVFANGWISVGGMNLSSGTQPITPAYSWPWGDNNYDPNPNMISYGGFWYAGAFNWLKDGGLRYGLISVDNSIDSYDAYITQTIRIAPDGTPALPDYPQGTPGGPLDLGHGGAYTGLLGQQFIQFRDPNSATGGTGIWVQLSYGTGEVDGTVMNDNSAWQWTTVNCDPATALTELTVKIGIVKDPAVNTGARSLMLEDFLLWAWGMPYLRWDAIPVNSQTDYVQWDNYTFDNNFVLLKLPSSSLQVNEQGPTSTTYDVVCVGSAPGSNVTVTITPDSQTSINGAGAGVPYPLTFTSGNYSMPQTVTVTAVNDALVEGPHTSTITHTVSSSDASYNQVSTAPLTVNILDNDVKSVVISPLSVSVDEEGETMGTYTVVLGAAPTANVTVTATRSTPDVTLDAGSGPGAQANVVFTTANWSTPQTITVQAIDDVLAEGPEAVAITHSAASSDAGYNLIAIDSVTVDIMDNDTAGWVPVGGMALDYEWYPVPSPLAAYSWPWGDNNYDPNPNLISYGGFWYGGAFSWLKNGGLRYARLSVDNSIGSYDAYITQTILLPAGLIDTGHGGAYTGTLGQQFLHWVNPSVGNGTTSVWVDISYGTGEVDSYSQAAGSAWAWNAWLVAPATPLTEVTVKIGLVKDPAVTTGTRTLIVEDALMWAWALPLNTTPPSYAQWENFNFDFKANWRENIIVLKPSSNPLQVNEQGATSTTYGVVCADDLSGNVPPVSNVTVTITPDSQTRINGAGQGVPANLTFTPGNYNTPQTVTVTAIDDAFVEGLHTSTIIYNVSSADPNYASAVIAPLTVNIEDNDLKGVVVTPLALAVAEEGETTDTYTVSLSAPPSANVTVTAARATPDVTVDAGTGPGAQAGVTFTSGTWATPQMITVKAVDDALSEGPETTTITHSSASSDSGYNALSIDSVSVAVTDNEEYCGEAGQVYLEFDVAGPEGIGNAYRDCKVNFYDFAAVASQWLNCTDRFDPECVQWQ